MNAPERRNSLRKAEAPEPASARRHRSQSSSRNEAATGVDTESTALETSQKKSWRSRLPWNASSRSSSHYPPRAGGAVQPLVGDLSDGGNTRGRERPRSRARAMDNKADEEYARTNQEQAPEGPSGQEHMSNEEKDLPPAPETTSTNEPDDADASFAEKLRVAREEITHLKSVNARLQKKLTDTAASRTDADPLSISRVPENIIISDFHTLIFRIHNFVNNYYKVQSKPKFKAWAEEHHRFLADIYPDPTKVPGEKGMSTSLVEAAIWKSMMGNVFTGFGEARGTGMLWAGRYAGRVANLANILGFSVDRNDREMQRAFHHWRALTTSLVVGVDSRHTCRDEWMIDVVDAIENLLEPLATGTSNLKNIREGLEEIVNKAVELDQNCCSQQTYYTLRYPAPPYNGKADSTEVVAVTAGGKPVEKKAGMVSYNFVIAPRLHRSGGRRGEGYGMSDGVVLEPAKVYHAGSRVWG